MADLSGDERDGKLVRAEQSRSSQKVQQIVVKELGGQDSLYRKDCIGAAGTKRKAVSGRTPPENPGICLD